MQSRPEPPVARRLRGPRQLAWIFVAGCHAALCYVVWAARHTDPGGAARGGRSIPFIVVATIATVVLLAGGLRAERAGRGFHRTRPFLAWLLLFAATVALALF